MTPPAGETVVGVIDRISKSGNALVPIGRNNHHLNLGPIPHIEGDLTVRITSPSAFDIVEFQNQGLLTMTLTEQCIHRQTSREEGSDITDLLLGDRRLLRVVGPMPLGKLVSVQYKQVDDTFYRGTRLSSQRAKELRRRQIRSRGPTGGATVDGASVSDLLKQMNRWKSKTKRRNTSNRNARTRPGGTAREKGTCKCCGVQVDVGTHKCVLCLDAGCSVYSQQCRFT